MSARNSALRYGSVAMTFHWLIALLVATNLLLGFIAANVLDDKDPSYLTTMPIHKSIGLTVLVLSILRLGWRLINPDPPLPADLSGLMRFLARSSHILFYFFIIAIPLAGWALVSSSPRGTPTIYFYLFQWPHIPMLADLPRAAKHGYAEFFGESHELLAYSAGILVVMHVSAALWHHFRRHDDVLKRMLPGTRLTAG